MESKLFNRRTNIFLGERTTTAFNRFSAKSIDALLVCAAYFLGQALWLPLGVGAALFLSAFQDAFGNGQSAGKRIIGLQVVDDPTALPCSFHASLVRNLPFTLLVLCASVSILWAVLVCIALPLVLLESYFILTLATGVRLGDVLANTLVMEYFDESLGLGR